jgi:hypothetical protein
MAGVIDVNVTGVYDIVVKITSDTKMKVWKK